MMPPVKEPLAGLALLVIFGLLIWYNRPIETSPPFDPYPQRQTPRISGDTYEAWLWKDPFGFDPAAASGGAFEAQKEWGRVMKGKKPDKKSEGPVQGSYKICQDQIQVRLKKILDLDKQLKEGEKRKSVNNEGDKKKPVILAPLVKVTPDTVENKEMRTRQRYAVVAGLIDQGIGRKSRTGCIFAPSRRTAANMTCAGSIIGMNPKAARKATLKINRILSLPGSTVKY